MTSNRPPTRNWSKNTRYRRSSTNRKSKRKFSRFYRSSLIPIALSGLPKSNRSRMRSWLRRRRYRESSTIWTTRWRSSGIMMTTIGLITIFRASTSDMVRRRTWAFHRGYRCLNRIIRGFRRGTAILIITSTIERRRGPWLILKSCRTTLWRTLMNFWSWVKRLEFIKE